MKKELSKEEKEKLIIKLKSLSKLIGEKESLINKLSSLIPPAKN